MFDGVEVEESRIRLGLASLDLSCGGCFTVVHVHFCMMMFVLEVAFILAR